MYFHGGFADPLGWIKRSSFTVPQFTSEDILTLLTPVQQSKSAVLVIDSLSWLLRHLDPVVICKRLQEIKRGVHFRALSSHTYDTFTFTFTFSNLADAFVQSDVQGREQSS